MYPRLNVKDRGTVTGSIFKEGVRKKSSGTGKRVQSPHGAATVSEEWSRTRATGLGVNRQPSLVNRMGKISHFPRMTNDQ